MRIAVTGASGFIGGHVARALARDGHDVHSFGRRSPAAVSQALPNYRAWDITTAPLVGVAVDAVVHCAAAVGQWGEDAWFEAVNVTGTRRVLAAVPATARVVCISSASVYARRGGTALREDAPLDEQRNAYVRTKVRAERLVLSGDRSAIVLRPHVVYGPGDTTLWPRVHGALRRGRLLVPGDGQSRISTTHVGNLVEAVRCALRPDAPSGPYNIADAEAPTVDTLLHTIFRRQCVPVRITYIPALAAHALAAVSEAVWHLLRRPSEPPLTRYAVASLATPCLLDASRAAQLLGYRPTWNIATGPLAPERPE